MKKDWIYRRGDIYLANLGVPVGSKQGGTRPVVILQNNTGNYFSPTVTIAPITSKVEKKRKQPTHFFIRKAKGLTKPSMVLAEQLDTCDKSRIIKYLGGVSWGQMRGIDEAVRVQLGYYIPERARKEKQDEFHRKLEISSQSGLTKDDIVAQTQDINNNDSRLCEAGVNMKVIQDFLGHADISTTMNIYTDATKDFKALEINRFDEYLREKSE